MAPLKVRQPSPARLHLSSSSRERASPRVVRGCTTHQPPTTHPTVLPKPPANHPRARARTHRPEPHTVHVDEAMASPGLRAHGLDLRVPDRDHCL